MKLHAARQLVIYADNVILNGSHAIKKIQKLVASKENDETKYMGHVSRPEFMTNSHYKDSYEFL